MQRGKERPSSRPAEQAQVGSGGGTSREAGPKSGQHLRGTFLQTVGFLPIRGNGRHLPSPPICHNLVQNVRLPWATADWSMYLSAESEGHRSADTAGVWSGEFRRKYAFCKVTLTQLKFHQVIIKTSAFGFYS